jgi:hypothetical protein
MIKGYSLLIKMSLQSIVSKLSEGFEKETLGWIILILGVIDKIGANL